METIETELVKNFPYEIHQVRGPNEELVWVQRGINPDNVFDDKRRSDWPFSNVMADLICEKIVEGHSLTSICKQIGFPTYAAICRWRREQPEFKVDLEQAYRDRSEFFLEKLIDLATDGDLEENPKVLQLKLDVLKLCAADTLRAAKIRKQKESFLSISVSSSVDV